VPLNVRPMQLEEVSVVIDYFHRASAEHLETLGVDPTRLPDPSKWRQLYEHEYSQPLERRGSFMVLWELEGRPMGFSTVDRLKYGEEAYMHLHVIDPALYRREILKSANGNPFHIRNMLWHGSREKYVDAEEIRKLRQVDEGHYFNMGPIYIFGAAMFTLFKIFSIGSDNREFYIYFSALGFLAYLVFRVFRAFFLFRPQK